MSDPIERLSSLFERFPGIGPRQAQRFVQLLLRSPALRRELGETLRGLSSASHQCPECMRYHAGDDAICSLCGNPERDQALLAVVVNDADLAALERSGTFRGRYFVLGGTVSLASEKATGLRLRELTSAVKRPGINEVILAMPANPEGDATANHVRHEIIEMDGAPKVTMLGRGLSTGSELEYADPETLKSAIANRK